MCMKNCTRCGVLKGIDNFHTRSDNGRPYSYCKECHRKYTKTHYLNNKKYYIDKATKHNISATLVARKWLNDYLSVNPCVDCGNSDIEVLQFDHKDRSLKSGEVSKFLSYSLNRLQEEVFKCEVRCANCHIKKTRRQLGWWVVD